MQPTRNILGDMDSILRPLSGTGVEVVGMGAAEVLAAMEAEDGTDGDYGRLVDHLSTALREHGLLYLRASSSESVSHSLSPQQIRGLYERLHKARFPDLELRKVPWRETMAKLEDKNCTITNEEVNLRGKCFPGFPESAVLGYTPDGIEDYHGLTGKITPRSWWEKISGEFHHDGAFSAKSPIIPALVSMYCEEAPIDDSSIEGFTMKWETGESMYCPPGSTLFYQTGRALALASPEVASRARRMRCVYTGGFDRVREGQYPCMSDTFLTALEAPKVCIELEYD